MPRRRSDPDLRWIGVLWYEDGASLMDNLEAKVAVITGAASGIGLEMAREFGHQGMRVVLSDVSEEHLNNAVIELQSEGIESIGDTHPSARHSGALVKLAVQAVEDVDAQF